MEKVKISSLITEKISGEWGADAVTKEAVNVIRTANFTNSGVITFHNIVRREIEKKVIDKKQLINGDIIIEKSGGSPSQPVGRVVYFENPDNQTYLCNNFTTVLRPDIDKVNPKYLFYLLYYSYQTGKVLAFQNKTTGIINLKLDRYLDSDISYEPDLETQNKIVAILDKAKIILDKREKTIALYDELLRATFLEMFGDPFKLINKRIVTLNTVVNHIDSGWSPVCEETPRASSDQLAVLRQGAVSKRYFVPERNKLLPYGLIVKKAIYARHKNLLFSRKNTPELVGATTYLFEDHENLLLPDTIFNIRYDESKISGVYLYYLFNNIEFRKKIQRLSVGQAESMSNISQEKLLKLEIPLPDLDLQKEFEKIVTSSYSSVFAKLQKSKTGLERLLRSLSQQVFSERITIDIDTELEALINAIDLDKKEEENKIDTIVNDITFAQRLIDRLEEQEFENHLQYDKAKYILFRILKEEEDLVKQIFKNNKVALTLQNETT